MSLLRVDVVFKKSHSKRIISRGIYIETVPKVGRGCGLSSMAYSFFRHVATNAHII